MSVEKQPGSNDPYEFVYDNWLTGQNVPVVDHHHILNLRTLELRDWERRGGRVCFINYPLDGGNDRYSDCYVVELPPGGEPQPHPFGAGDHVRRAGGRDGGVRVPHVPPVGFQNLLRRHVSSSSTPPPPRPPRPPRLPRPPR